MAEAGVHGMYVHCLLYWLCLCITPTVHMHTDENTLNDQPTPAIDQRSLYKHSSSDYPLNIMRDAQYGGIRITNLASTRMPEFVPDGEREFEPDPTFLESQPEVIVHEGDLATLRCLIQHIGAREVSWEKLNEHLISIGTRVWAPDANLRISHQQMPAHVTVWDLQFLEARMTDSGTYECKIIAKDIVSKQVQLTVLERPPHNPVISIEGKEYVDVGQTVYLKCNTTEGDRTPENVDWFKNGDKIEPSTHPNIVITKFKSDLTRSLMSELLIVSGTQKDSGTYICRSSTEQIASVDVQVLLADSNNVKRGTGASHTQAGSAQSDGENCAVYFSVLSHNPVIFCLVILAHYVINYVNT